jgi:hypothetical protein
VDDVSHHLGRCEWFGAGALQVEVELRVGVAGGELFGQFERERRLAHTTMPRKPEMVTPLVCTAFSNSANSSARPVKSRGGCGS